MAVRTEETTLLAMSFYICEGLFAHRAEPPPIHSEDAEKGRRRERLYIDDKMRTMNEELWDADDRMRMRTIGCGRDAEGMRKGCIKDA